MAAEKINEDGCMASYQSADREVQIFYNDVIAKDYLQFDSAFLISIGILAAAYRFSASTHSENLSDLELNFDANGLKIYALKVHEVCLMML
ncbi:hypothetical protein [Bartonella sp. B39]